MTNLISTAEAAARLKMTRQRVRVLITEGRLAAQRVGRAYLVLADSVAQYEARPCGRPPQK